MAGFSDKKVSWGIPEPDELEDAVIPEGSPGKAPASYVYRKKKSILDQISPTTPFPVWEGSVYKKRRIRGGWTCKHFTIAATCSMVDDGENSKAVKLSFNYRDSFHEPVPIKMRGHIEEILLWTPDDEYSVPKSGCGFVINCVTDDGRYKRYELCCANEGDRENLMATFEETEQDIREEITGEAETEMDKGERSATAAFEKQSVLLSVSIGCLEKLVAMHEVGEGDVSLDESSRKILSEDLDCLNLSIKMFKEIECHLKTSKKDGASLSTKRLEQFVVAIQSAIDQTMEIKGIEDDPVLMASHFLSNQHRQPLNQSLATAIVAIQDMQFGMIDREALLKGKTRMRSISDRLLNDNQLSPGISQDMVNNLTPPSGRAKKSLKKQWKYTPQCENEGTTMTIRDRASISSGEGRQSRASTTESQESRTLDTLTTQQKREINNKKFHRRATGHFTKQKSDSSW